jgi:putative transposase
MAVRRIERPNHARFLTFSCFHRLALFSNDAIKDIFAEQLQRTRDRHAFLLYAWVVMPEHVHLLLRANGPSDVPTILQTLRSGVAKRVIRRWRELNAPVLSRLRGPHGRTHFWQRGQGYDRNLVNGPEFEEKFRYIHENPVRRGLVSNPTDWPWSSARWWSGLREGEIPCDPTR